MDILPPVPESPARGGQAPGLPRLSAFVTAFLSAGVLLVVAAGGLAHLAEDQVVLPAGPAVGAPAATAAGAAAPIPAPASVAAPAAAPAAGAPAPTAATVGTVPAANGTNAVATAWPLRAHLGERDITIYQPQPERLAGDTLAARAALAVSTSGGDPVFGVVWFNVRLAGDSARATMAASSVVIERVTFADSEAGDDASTVIDGDLQRVLAPADLVFDRAQLMADLEQAPADGSRYNAAPPRILIRTTPSVLLLCDGEPRLEQVGGLNRVVNTPSFACVDANGTWWLRLENGWLTALAVGGPWSPATPPAEVVAGAAQAGVAVSAGDNGATRETLAPVVIVATVPTALVVFAGEPRWTPIAETGILAAENCDGDAYLDTATGRCWLMLAGRWFSAERLADGVAWTPVAPDALPAGFAAIPADSRWAQTRVHVSGTPEAHAAVVEAQVPQTARVPRSATITVTYDGAPRFTPIPGSDAEWAENSAFTVFRTPGPRYWCCDQAVWYEAPDALGPWTVATAIPEALHRIPADHPTHNVTYVYVYDSAPEYVWTGYTAGYVNHYIYDGCPIYGSGWYWHGYYHPGHCYPRPLTWGVSVTYDPWAGVWASGHHRSGGQLGGAVYVGGGQQGGWWGPSRQQPIALSRPHPVVSGGYASWRPPTSTVQIVRPTGANIYQRVPGAQVPVRPIHRPVDPQARPGQQAGLPSATSRPSAQPSAYRPAPLRPSPPASARPVEPSPVQRPAPPLTARPLEPPASRPAPAADQAPVRPSPPAVSRPVEPQPVQRPSPPVTRPVEQAPVRPSPPAVSRPVEPPPVQRPSPPPSRPVDQAPMRPSPPAVSRPVDQAPMRPSPPAVSRPAEPPPVQRPSPPPSRPVDQAPLRPSPPAVARPTEPPPAYRPSPPVTRPVEPPPAFGPSGPPAFRPTPPASQPGDPSRQQTPGDRRERGP